MKKAMMRHGDDGKAIAWRWEMFGNGWEVGRIGVKAIRSFTFVGRYWFRIISGRIWVERD